MVRRRCRGLQRTGHEAVVKLLLEKGADVESKDRCMAGRRCRGLRENGHEAVVKLLLEKGADVESKDQTYGQTPLSWAAENGTRGGCEAAARERGRRGVQG